MAATRHHPHTMWTHTSRGRIVVRVKALHGAGSVRVPGAHQLEEICRMV